MRVFPSVAFAIASCLTFLTCPRLAAQEKSAEQAIREKTERFLTGVKEKKIPEALREFLAGSPIEKHGGRQIENLTKAIQTVVSELGDPTGFEEIRVDTGPELLGCAAYVLYLDRAPAYFLVAYALREEGPCVLDLRLAMDHDEVVALLGAPAAEPPAGLRARCEAFLDAVASLEVDRAFREIADPEQRDWWSQRVGGASKNFRQQLARIGDGKVMGRHPVRVERLTERLWTFHYLLDHGGYLTWWSFSFFRHGEKWYVIDLNLASNFHQLFWLPKRPPEHPWY